jgi:hypothetical protein
MSYEILNQILTPNRVLDIWESEKDQRERRKIFIHVTQINDRIETILENLDQWRNFQYE